MVKARINWERFREDPLGFASLMRRRPKDGTVDHRLMLEAASGATRIGTIGADIRTLIVVGMWRLLCFKERASTVFVTKDKEVGRAIMALAEDMVLRSVSELRERVRISREQFGISRDDDREFFAFTHCTPQALEMGPSTPREAGALLLVIPKMDSIPNCYIRDAARLSKVPGISVLLNV